MVMFDPWFSHWNHRLLETLFQLVPHTQTTDDRFDDLISNPFWGTWIFAAFFYRFWAIDDGQQERRRSALFIAVVAIGVSFFITALLRPFIGWPAPVLNTKFQQLFPEYLWGQGRWNCFPSHSTLAYFTIAAGFWSLNRSVSICLSLLSLAVVSLPRVYLGGHYPVDVVFSIVLSLCTLIVVSRWQPPATISRWFIKRGNGTAIRDWLLFLWVFELGEGFRGTEFTVAAIRKMMSGP